jgi:hypothetical protein
MEQVSQLSNAVCVTKHGSGDHAKTRKHLKCSGCLEIAASKIAFCASICRFM